MQRLMYEEVQEQNIFKARKQAVPAMDPCKGESVAAQAMKICPAAVL